MRTRKEGTAPETPQMGGRAFVLAIAAHAVLLGVLALRPLVHSAPDPRAPPAPEPVAIEVVEERSEVAAPAARVGEVAGEAARAAGGAGRAPLATVATRDVALERRAEGEPAAQAPAPAPAPAPVEAPVVSLVMPPSPAALGLELGAPNRFVQREAPPAPKPPGTTWEMPYGKPRTNEEAKRFAEGMLRAPARARERELGLGPEGPVLTALGEATSISTTPVHGRAVFLAVADGTGMIVGIDVVECDGARDGWTKAAALARSALMGKKLRLPSSAKRAEMRIEITSAWKLQSGHDPGLEVTVLGLPLKKGEGPQATSISVLDPTTGDVLGLRGDPVDIGAKPRRVVHARLLDSKVL